MRFRPFELHKFRGIVPKINPALLREGAATEAIDCSFRAGTILPRNKPRYIKDLKIGYGASNRTAGGLVMMPDGREFGTTTPCQQCGYGGRVFVAGDGTEAPYYLRQSDATLTKYQLGIPAEGFNLSASASGGVSTDTVDVVYAISFQNREGDESDLFGETTLSGLKIDGTGNIGISKSPGVAPTWDTTGAKINLYATSRVSSTAAAEYKWIHSWTYADAGNGASFSDISTTRRQETKTVYSSATTPPAGMKKMLTMGGGFLVGHTDNELWFSEVGKPATWPSDYRIIPPGGGKIIGIGLQIEQLYVFVENSPPFIVNAQTPLINDIYFSQVPWPCIAGGSVVNSGTHGLLYASKSGMAALSGQQGALLTQEVLDERTFEPYRSVNARCIRFDDGVIVHYGGDKTLIIDPQEQEGLGISELSIVIKDAKEYNGTMYFVSDNGEMYENEGGADKQTAIWVSSVLRSRKKQVLNYMSVFGKFDEANQIIDQGGIGADTIGSLAIGDSSSTQDENMFLRESKIQLFDYESGRKTPQGAPMKISDTEEFPIRSGVPIYDIQVKITTKDEIEAVFLSTRAER